MTSSTLYVIGLGQLVNWGVLFFAFGVLLVPVAETLGVPRWLVAGAFSLALLISATAAPAVGRLADRGQGPAVMQAGGFIAAGLLIAWAAMPTLLATYLIWAALGACMAGILYEPVFAIIGRAFADGDTRLRAIATVTITGGLASTAFLPGTSFLVKQLGWRGAVVALAAIIALSTFSVSRLAFKDLTVSLRDLREAISDRVRVPVESPGSLNRLVLVFSLSSVAASAVASNIVAALIERQLSPERAATIGGLLGVMQLPGRALMMNRSFAPVPFHLVTVSFTMQIAGLLALMSKAQAMLWLGISLFACGSGLATLARPYLVLHFYGAGRAGSVNGIIARGQQLARAAGPVSAAALASAAGYGRVFAATAILLVAAIILTPRHRTRPIQAAEPD
jgi:MFS family permease